MKQRIWGLDILRALAILLVLLLHSAPFFPETSAHWPKFFFFGWSGVDLFFVLSGYLVGSQAYDSRFDSGKSILEFWLKRWFRTLPLYFFVLMIYLLLKPMAGFPFQGEPVLFFVFAQNYFSPKDFVQTWSLCIEEQFYFFLPLVFLFGGIWHRWPWLWLLGLFVSLGSRYFFWLHHPGASPSQIAYALQFPTHMHLDGLCLGLFLAGTRDYWTHWSLFLKRALFFLGIVVLLFSFIKGAADLTGFSMVWLFLLLSLGFTLLVPLMVSVESPHFSSPVGRQMGSVVTAMALWSYGLYLWNNLIFRLAEELPLPPSGRGILGWAAVFFVSWLTYRFLELPVMHWRNFFLLRLHKPH